jgi:hypothetical protein
LGDGLGEGLGVALGDGLGVALGEGLGEAVGDGLGVAVGDGEGLGPGEEVEQGAVRGSTASSPVTIPMRPPDCICQRETFVPTIELPAGNVRVASSGLSRPTKGLLALIMRTRFRVSTQ